MWRIKNANVNVYEGRAADVVGVAKGKISGNALNWTYEIDLKVGDRTWSARFDHWMFRQPDGVLLNRAKVTKFGIEIGEVTLFF